MKKIANIKDKYGIVFGYIYKDGTEFILCQKGCSPSIYSTLLKDVEEFLREDKFFGGFGCVPFYLKSFKR